VEVGRDGLYWSDNDVIDARRNGLPLWWHWHFFRQFFRFSSKRPSLLCPLLSCVALPLSFFIMQSWISSLNYVLGDYDLPPISGELRSKWIQILVSFVPRRKSSGRWLNLIGIMMWNRGYLHGAVDYWIWAIHNGGCTGRTCGLIGALLGSKSARRAGNS